MESIVQFNFVVSCNKNDVRIRSYCIENQNFGRREIKKEIYHPINCSVGDKKMKGH